MEEKKNKTLKSLKSCEGDKDGNNVKILFWGFVQKEKSYGGHFCKMRLRLGLVWATDCDNIIIILPLLLHQWSELLRKKPK